jgi:hypothetical protein
MNKYGTLIPVASKVSAPARAELPVAAPKRAMVLLTRPRANPTMESEGDSGNTGNTAAPETVVSGEPGETDMNGARFAVAALQGFWESQRDPSETYSVHGLDVTRSLDEG